MQRRGQHGDLSILVGGPGAARVDRNRVVAVARVGFLNVLSHDLRIGVDDSPPRAWAAVGPIEVIARQDDRAAGRRLGGDSRRGWRRRVAGGVDRIDGVEISRARRQAAVGVDQRRDRRNQTAVSGDPIPGDANVVSRGGPRQRHLAARWGRATERARRARRLRICGRLGGDSRRGGRRCVAGGIDRDDGVEIGRAGGQAAVGIRQRRDRGDQTAVSGDSVCGDADVVGRRGPRQQHLAARWSRAAERARRTRRLRIRAAAAVDGAGRPVIELPIPRVPLPVVVGDVEPGVALGNGAIALRYHRRPIQLHGQRRALHPEEEGVAGAHRDDAAPQFGVVMRHELREDHLRTRAKRTDDVRKVHLDDGVNLGANDRGGALMQRRGQHGDLSYWSAGQVRPV